MKKYTLLLAAIISVFNATAQNSNSNSILIRHDTTLLKAEECEWVIKSLTKNDPALTSAIGKQLPLIILEAIEKGKLKAVDPETNKPIPGKQIFIWKLPADSVYAADTDGNPKYFTVQRRHSSDNFTSIRVFQDWYFDLPTGKLRSVIKWMELLEEIHTSTGIFLGYAPLCRIYY